MKIAFVTDDEQTISAHFGRAPKVIVVSVEDGKEIAREVRLKEAHQPGEVRLYEPDQGHSHHGDHGSKFEAIRDCDILVARGMGTPAIAHAEGMGMRVFLTAKKEIDTALEAFLAGSLDHDERRIHQH